MLTKQNPYVLEAQDADIAVQTWREEIRERHGVGFFSGPAESVPVATSVARWLISRRLPLPLNLSLTSILADPARTKDVRGFFSGRFDLVKLAFVHQFGGEHVVPDFKIGNMHFDYAVVSPVGGSSNRPPLILYVSLRDPDDTLLEGAIGKTMDETLSSTQ